MKLPIVIDEKKKLRKVNNYGYDKSDDNDGKSQPKTHKFICFLLPINQNIPGDL